MNQELIQFLGIGGLIIFWSSFFKPLQSLKKKYILDPLVKADKWDILAIYKHLNCPKCLGLWIGLIVYQNIYLAILLSIYTYLLNLVLYDPRSLD